ncbi:ficolin-1-like [Drosophila obscura]|uniref:ficolin-1-like n=1 Tax=Drosophila obscura TaxID=7282 RepID=UPI001BB2B0C5|nr:ficolin-1-like [Drosophila obscura]
MWSSGFVVITLCACILQGKTSRASGEEDIPHLTKDVGIAEQCNGYCFTVLQPFLENFTHMNVTGEIKDKIHSLEESKLKLQYQLLDSMIEIENNAEQIKHLSEQVKAMSEVQINQTAENLPSTCPKIEGIEPFLVPCEPSSSGWTVIQRRIDGSTNFNRNWTEYKLGFGNLQGNFFLGLEKIHLMTKNQSHELFIHLQKIDGSTSFAQYDDFQVGSEEEGYNLKSLGKFYGPAGDSLIDHLNMKFTTFDRDNDFNDINNCAKGDSGGWWYNDCGYSSLNGKYYADGWSDDTDGINWGTWQYYKYTGSLTNTQMMIRPTSYKS